MKRPYFLTLVVAAALLGPAAANTTRDQSGRTVSVTQWTPIAAHEFLIGVGDLPDVVADDTAQRFRKDGGVQQYMWFDDRQSLLWVEVSHDVFRPRNTHALRDPDSAREQIRKWFRKHGQKPVYIDSRPLSGRPSMVGNLNVVEGTPQRNGKTTRCVFGHLGFLGDPQKGVADMESFDTYVLYRDCSGRRTPARVVEFLENL